MKIAFKASAALLAAALGLSAGAATQSVEPYTQLQAKAAAVAPTKAERAKATSVKQFALAAPILPKIAASGARMGVPMQVGFGRAVAGIEDAASALDWETTSAGTRVAALSITSTDAAAVRAGLLVQALPAGAMLRFYTPYEDTIHEVSGREVLDTIARNVAADGDSADARTFWSPPMEGATAVVEIELPAGVRQSDVRVSVPSVTHLVTSAKKNFAVPKDLIELDTCENDAVCSIADWGPQMNSVARMLFNVGASGFLCSGSLLGNTNGDSTPYFLTANHCFQNQTSASTLTTYWFYRDTGCVTDVMNPGMFTLTGGSTFLYGSNNTDTTFVRLNNAPPAGAVFSGWLVSSPGGIGAGITGIHHPHGELQKISFGSITVYLVCTPPSGGSFTCPSGGSNPLGNTFYGTVFTSGTTEPGSSGSPLFLNAGKYIIGQLYGGSGSCANQSGGEVYGRLDIAYSAGVNQFLAPPLPTFALTATKNGTGLGTLTTTPAGINCGATCTGNFTQDSNVTVIATPTPGSLFAGWGGACSGTGACVVSMSAAQAVSATFDLAPPVALTVVKAGLGTGTVTSTPAGINCGATCTNTFAAASVVNLAATPTAGHIFTGWSGACTGVGACSVTMTTPQSVTATFAPPPQLVVTKAGTGTGTVTSTPAGISCGATCSAPFNANNNVNLTAVADAGSTFAGWSVGCIGTRGCLLVMNGDKAVTATFNLSGPPRTPMYMLNVVLAGTGTGSVASTPAGIACGATCGFNFDQGTPVTLTPTASVGSTFAGWSGACTGTGACVVTMNAAASVTATFNTSAPPPPGNQTLTIIPAGTGTGSIVSSPAGINCGATCSAGFPTGTMVRLTATPAMGSTLVGFTGACVNTRSTCTVTMSAAASVTVTFSGSGGPPPPTQQTLTVSLAGTGTGSVASSPAGIACGATCNANFNTGTPVTLTPTAGGGSTFAGWSGACSGTGACVVTMNAAASVTATFNTSGGGGGNPTLTVVKAGAGAALGTVTTTPAGINCGATCSAQFTAGAGVTLTATVAPGRSFGGWTGACTGTRLSCTIPAFSVSGAATATFN